MERLTLEHILSLIEHEEYAVEEQYVQCILYVGEAPVIGTSYRFSKSTHDPERAKIAAREDAIRSLFSLEAYHQKRLRSGNTLSVAPEAVVDTCTSTVTVTVTSFEEGCDGIQETTGVREMRGCLNPDPLSKCPCCDK